eukprot:7055706-Prymnesium_polylepis.1
MQTPAHTRAHAHLLIGRRPPTDAPRARPRHDARPQRGACGVDGALLEDGGGGVAPRVESGAEVAREEGVEDGAAD